MAEYALVENGEVVSVGPEPQSWENPDGSTTTTPEDTDTDPKILKKLGYLPVEDARPDVVPEGEHLVQGDFTVTKAKVVRNWTTEPMVEPIDPMEEHRRFVDEAVAGVTALFTELRDRHDAALAAIEGFAQTLTELGDVRALVTTVATLEARVAQLSRDAGK
jgi:hypothetical protein